MSDSSVPKTLVLAIVVSIVCSALVATTAVSLHTAQEENRRLDRIKNILEAAGFDAHRADMLRVYKERIRPVVIDLSRGMIVPEHALKEGVTAETFDIIKSARDPVYGMSIPGDADTGRIKRMPRHMIAYFIMDRGETAGVVLPVYGKGLWSTMYGFLALERDMKTVKGITFYEHGETPGLGGEVDNRQWKASWKGKRVFDENGTVRIEVVKGAVDRSRPDAKYKIDGLSGATLTSRGVSNLVRFWLGQTGYGPLLEYLKEKSHG